MSDETVEVPQRWVDEMCIAVGAATIIGQRSCRDGDHLHYANHDRLLREATAYSKWAQIELDRRGNR